tara:strand:+ start:681 stop:947 length:267 start_codon:yes stop_codon:yes gene_type:complete
MATRKQPKDLAIRPVTITLEITPWDWMTIWNEESIDYYGNPRGEITLQQAVADLHDSKGELQSVLYDQAGEAIAYWARTHFEAKELEG